MEGEQRKRSKQGYGGFKRRQQGGVGDCGSTEVGSLPGVNTIERSGKLNGCFFSLLWVSYQPYSLQSTFGSLGW